MHQNHTAEGPSASPIQGKTTITRRDYRALAYFNVFQRHPAEPYVLGAIAIGAASIIIAYILPQFHPWQFLFHLSWIFWALLLIIFLVIEGITHQYLETEGGRTVGRELGYSFDRTAVQILDGENVTTISWPGFFKAIELKRHFILFLTINHAVIVPKRALKAEDLPALRDLIRQCMGRDFILRCREEQAKFSKNT